jgi:hypothetical protein
MARDAIARQYDVDKNRVTLVCETESGSYRPGTILFFPKKGKTLDLRKMVESITATRLSGGTGMSVDWLLITASGTVRLDGETALFSVSGTKQRFLLKEGGTKAGEKSPLQRLREAVASGAKVVSVTGRVDGWTGGFPVVLRALGKLRPDEPVGLVVTYFETAAK